MIETLFRLYVCPKTVLLVTSFCGYLKEFLSHCNYNLTKYFVSLLPCFDLGSKITQPSHSLWGQTPCANRLGVEGSTEIERRMRMMVLFTLVRKKILENKLEFKLRKQLTIS